MSNPRKEVGFIGSFGKMKLIQFIWPEGVLATIVGGGGGTCLVLWGTIVERGNVINEGLTIAGVLLGIVFAAFSLLFALFSDDYLRLLTKMEGGIATFTRPYILALGFQVMSIFFAIGYNAVVAHVSAVVSNGVFIFWSFLFSYSLVDVVALGRNVALHGIRRAQLAVGNSKLENANSNSTD